MIDYIDEFENMIGIKMKAPTEDLLVGSLMWMEVFKKDLERVFDNENKMGRTTETDSRS